MNDVEIVRGIAQPLTGGPDDCEASLELIGIWDEGELHP